MSTKQVLYSSSGQGIEVVGDFPSVTQDRPEKKPHEGDHGNKRPKYDMECIQRTRQVKVTSFTEALRDDTCHEVSRKY